MKRFSSHGFAGWIPGLAVVALLWSCASPSSGNGGAGGQGGGSSGGTGTGGLGTGGASGSGGTTAGASGGATGGSSTGGSGGSGGSRASTGGTGVTSTGGMGGASAGGSGGSASGGSRASGGTTGTGGFAGASGGRGGSGAAGSGGLGGGGSTGTGGTATCTPGPSWSGGQQYTANSVGSSGNGYSYQLWFTGGSGSMTVAGTDARFSAVWNNPTDFLARVGLTFNSTKTFDQLGTVSADFAHTKTGSAGYSFIGIYGWSVNPIVEYYIADDWFGSPPTADGGTKMGSFTVDGGTYDIYQHMQVNQPSVTGANATFPQFYSIRQTARQCGHISITEHYKKWASLGLNLGQMEEAKILVEVGGGGSGSITFTTAAVTAK